jgi:hypothetical protein
MLRVVELDVETFFEACREILQRRIVAANVGVTDHAHRYRGRRELTAVTVGTRFVARETWRRGVVSSLVTSVAGKGTMALAGVQKLRVIELRTLGRRRSKKKNCSRKGAKAQRRTQREPRNFFAAFFAPLRLCGRNHLISFRFNGGRSAIK